MSSDGYYSRRHRRGPAATLEDLVRQLVDIYADFERRGYFQEAFGSYCDYGYSYMGAAGVDIGAYVDRHIGCAHLWPVHQLRRAAKKVTEDQVFDLIEFLFEHVSKPDERSVTRHFPGDGLPGSPVVEYDYEYADLDPEDPDGVAPSCNGHYSAFKKSSGQADFREQVNLILRRYQDGFWLNEQGQISQLGEAEVAAQGSPSMVVEGLDEVEQRVLEAVREYRRPGASGQEMQEALSNLMAALAAPKGNTL